MLGLPLYGRKSQPQLKKRRLGKVLAHRMLLRVVWGGNYVEQNEYLRVFIGKLRKKIEPDPSQPRYIVTKPWIGYRFDLAL